MKPILHRTKKCIFGNLLIIFTVVGVVGGILLGWLLRTTRDANWPPRDVMYVAFVGEVFLSMLKCLILPLIMSSIIAAIGHLDLTLSRKIGARAIAYYMVTTVTAIILGMVLSLTIKPGSGGNPDPSGENGRNITTVDTLLDLIRKTFPPNIIQAAIEMPKTVLIPPSDEEIISQNLTLYDWKISMTFEKGMNILGIVMFSVVMGITLSKMGEAGKPLLEFFTTMGSAMMIITNWVIWLSPLGVFFLVTGKVLEMESLDVIAGQLGMYTMTVILGLFIHGFLILPLYFFIITRTLPFRFVLNMGQALVTAFGTGSSNATLPIAMACLEDKNGVDRRISRFVMPIGATINMDGTALYEAVAAIFIAQMRGLSLSIGQLLAISITATAASIGAAGIPQAGLVTMVMVLNAVGLPAEDVTIILAVDWLLDRFRTVINVLGDSLGAGLVSHLSKKELENIDGGFFNQEGLEVVETTPAKPLQVLEAAPAQIPAKTNKSS